MLAALCRKSAGIIPPELSDLTALKSLNLSYNKLNGEARQDKQRSLGVDSTIFMNLHQAKTLFLIDHNTRMYLLSNLDRSHAPLRWTVTHLFRQLRIQPFHTLRDEGIVLFIHGHSLPQTRVSMIAIANLT